MEGQTGRYGGDLQGMIDLLEFNFDRVKSGQSFPVKFWDIQVVFVDLHSLILHSSLLPKLQHPISLEI